MRRSKADAIRRARGLRVELASLIDMLDGRGTDLVMAQRQATAIFEKARNLEYAIRELRQREELKR